MKNVTGHIQPAETVSIIGNRVSTPSDFPKEGGRRGLDDPLLSTGIESLDALLSGGIPRGHITEISGSVSAGRTSLLLSILAAASQRQESLAYVDAFDMLDPSFLNRGGIDANRLLWIRCRARTLRDRVDQSVKAADIVARSGGFGVLVLDLAHSEIPLPSVSTSSWFRLQRTIRGTPTSLLVVSPKRNLARATTVCLDLKRSRSAWGTLNSLRQPILNGIHSQVTLTRGSQHGRITLHCHL